jgi:hypothetical protein
LLHRRAWRVSLLAAGNALHKHNWPVAAIA